MRFFLLGLIFCISQIASASNSFLEEQLKQAIYHQQLDNIQILLKNYQQEVDSDLILIAYAQAKVAYLLQDYAKAISIYRQIISQKPQLISMRMELAVALFVDHQDNAAKLQFERVKSALGLPNSAYQKVESYLAAINRRNEWQANFTLSYLRTDNVENVSNDLNIENTGFIKSKKMLPQKAHGFAYSIDFGKDFNLINSHYISIQNETYGKNYWDNHNFDDLSTRILFGYAYKKMDNTFRIQPFYDKRWYGNHSFHWSNGIQFTYDFYFSKQWKNQTIMSFENRSFLNEDLQSGYIKTLSDTIIWYTNPQQLFYLGGAISQEKTNDRQYGSTSKNIRLGWLQEYQWGISSQLSFSFTYRKFHDEAILAGILPLNKTRRDFIYILNTKIWKRDWYFWGVTPKLNLVWKKQKSNLDTLYSYKDKQITILFEKTF